MKKYWFLLCLLGCSCSRPSMQMDLSGVWDFTTDTTSWKETINLPGSMTSNNLGDDISLATPWTGTIIDSSFFYLDKYAPYREPGNFKVPFWLQPVKYYKGEAWYRKKVNVPADWEGKDVILTLERCHWDTELWVDGHRVGSQHSLGVPHRYDLTPYLSAGEHELLLMVDNSLKTVDPGINSHSVSDHTQGNWNGVIGKIQLEAVAKCRIEQVDIYPDAQTGRISLSFEALNSSETEKNAILVLGVGNVEKEMTVNLHPGINQLAAEIQLEETVRLWDEFTPELYSLNVCLKDEQGKTISSRTERFGFRNIRVAGKHIQINGRNVFFRGMLDCAAYPITGYPPMDRESWVKLYDNCKKHGLNHVRFHTWCPPEVAFEVADEMGIYLQVECSSWANHSVTIGDGKPIDKFILEESERMVREYGNHPSFCMLLYGNEPAGQYSHPFLEKFVSHWKARDSRRIYSTAGGWPNLPVNDFLNDPTPRIQGWGQGLSSIINSQPPRTDYDWQEYVDKYSQPIICHEIGQWCVYPNFKEIEKYTGVMKARNFEIFKEDLAAKGLLHLADSFLLASGKLQTLCYKADIEATLRTKDYGGFQLLGLYDFPGQGTALVGVLDVFGDEKGYVSPEEYRSFCNTTVPLIRAPRLIYSNNETLSVEAEVAHFGQSDLKKVSTGWRLLDKNGNVQTEEKWNSDIIPTGMNTSLGKISVPLSMIEVPSQLKLEVYVDDFVNSWNFWVYPEKLEPVTMKDNFLMVDKLSSQAIECMNNGGNVLLSIPKGKLLPEAGGDIQVGFSSIFWNTAWTEGQAPHTLGILCNPEHPVFQEFPTSYHSDYQWWDAMTYSSAMDMNKLSKGSTPILRVIDDWFENRSLGLIAEFKVGKGKLLITSIDFWKDMDRRLSAKQLLYSIKKYMNSDEFMPSNTISVKDIEQIYK